MTVDCSFILQFYILFDIYIRFGGPISDIVHYNI